ncbi:TetR family transcriptional regulator [Actinocorallia sp. API 0066]|uniref:TetR/AcrR family transcriptional regulator n=1 Tax=Actinocorallia sp. API 0066 TaxID=2896846 RepID=UPI001E5D1683|nr:TetR family transcriptional regulator [Actinocorallia sp. API 0066]MCD0449625.1 TetR family transcriptional regulator [Actinocorallia sp. API 0066]
MTRRDPEGRRQAIIDAAGRVIAREGVGGLTHRKAAAEAGVPLGATTYYFTGLSELITAAFEDTAGASRELLAALGEALAASADPPAELARRTRAYLAEPERFRTANELYLAAAHRPELRPLARLWTDGLTDVLTPYAGAARARTIAVFLDGVLLRTLITGTPPDEPPLADALTALMRR